MKPYAFIDVDGTLINPNRRLYNLYVSITKTSIEYNDYWELKRKGFLMKDMFAFCNISSNRWHELKGEWLRLIELPEWLALDFLYDGVEFFLRQLSNRYSLVLWSNRQNKENLFREIKNMNIFDYFDNFLVTEFKTDKDDLIKCFSDNLYDSIAIGDTDDDRIAAEKNGVKFIGLNRFEEKHDYRLLLARCFENEVQ